LTDPALWGKLNISHLQEDLMVPPLLEKKKAWTYKDYLTLPEDNNLYEIIDGELYMTPAPTPLHQKVSHNLQRLLGNFVKQHDRGDIYPAPVDVVFDSSNIVQPDIIFISRENRSIVKEKNIQGAPDLVIEIVSPGTFQKDRVFKMKIYARYGVKNLWLIDPHNRTLEAFELDKETYRLVDALAGEEIFRPSLFPDLTIPLKEIWV